MTGSCNALKIRVSGWKQFIMRWYVTAADKIPVQLIVLLSTWEALQLVLYHFSFQALRWNIRVSL